MESIHEKYFISEGGWIVKLNLKDAYLTMLIRSDYLNIYNFCG